MNQGDTMKITFRDAITFAQACAEFVRQGVTFSAEQLDARTFVVTFSGGY